jgi:hypothetical protein
MHTTELDLGPALAKAGKVPPNTNVIVPTLNHSHLLDETVKGAVWWEIVSVLVTDESIWPNREGTVGITSLDALRLAQSQGKASPRWAVLSDADWQGRHDRVHQGGFFRLDQIAHAPRAGLGTFAAPGQVVMQQPRDAVFGRATDGRLGKF